jgi:Phage integrase family
VSEINVTQPPVSDGCETVGAWDTCLATPASPPLTSNPSSRSTPWRAPAATGSSPRPSAAPAPTAPPSSRCAHDFRHTYATWLEDAGIPARVIDELMGHEATSRTGQHRGSAMGAHYRHTTPEMAARVIDAIQQRLTIVLQVAEESLEGHPNWSAPGVF